MNLKISTNVSFDVEVACKYGHTEAILINHFAFWIRFNQRKNANFKDGRTWMYQTLDEIAENFPYLTKEQVRTTIDHLCQGKNRRSKGEKSFEPLLIKGNYNKAAMDRTCWYAFIDESILNSNNSYERVNAQMEWANAQTSGQMPRPIPKAIKTKATKSSSKEEAINRDEQLDSPESPLSNRKNKIAILTHYAKDFGFDISERDLGIWLSKYDCDRITRNIALAKRRKWSNLAKFLQSAFKYDYAKEEENSNINKEFLKKFCTKNNFTAHITKKYATLDGGIDLQFKFDPDKFNQMLFNYYTKQ